MLLEFLTADILNFRIHPIKWLISCILITEVIPIFTLLFITNLLIEVYIPVKNNTRKYSGMSQEFKKRFRKNSGNEK